MKIDLSLALGDLWTEAQRGSGWQGELKQSRAWNGDIQLTLLGGSWGKG